jgi:ribosome maturation factor RimP
VCSSDLLDRSLKTKKDFLRCLNKTVKIFLREPINDKFELEGVINNVDDNSVYVDTTGGIIKIPINAVNKAKQVIK